jgi:site-specific recombinase XerD
MLENTLEVLEHEVIEQKEITFAELIQMATDGLNSELSKPMYRKALNDFYDWYSSEGKPGFYKATIQRYKTILLDKKYSPATINLRLSAIRKLVQEGEDNGMISAVEAGSVMRVKGIEKHGIRTGNWLTLEQAQKLIDTPNPATLKGLRDIAILAVFLGAGLRRSEVKSLTIDQIQQRDNRWAIVNILGKHNHIRSVPIQSWVKTAIDRWTINAGIIEGHVFRAINRGERITSETISCQGIQNLVIYYGNLLGMKLSAHDLRRTYAILTYRGKADLIQIQMSLGHQNIETTKIYIGAHQDFSDAPCDHLALRI